MMGLRSRCWSRVLLGLFLLAVCPLTSGVSAQGLLMLPGLGSLGFEGVKITPSVQVGYQRISLNFTLPTVVPRIYPRAGTLDLQFQDSNTWVGSVGIVADCPSGFSLAIKGQANARRNITVAEPTELQLAGTGNVFWDGNHMEWWTLEGAVGYRVRDNWSFLVGLRREHLTVGLTNPRDSANNPLNFFFFFSDPFGTETEILTQTSDFRLKLWIPYIGLKMEGPGYRASILYSPYVTADIRIPEPVNIAQLFTSVFGPPFTGADLEGFDIRYKVLNLATFFEGDFEYDLAVGPNLSVGLWCSLSWLRLRGQGSLSIALSEEAFADGVPFESSGDSVLGRGDATCTRGIVAGGFSATLSF
jgi:hypothetical protein